MLVHDCTVCLFVNRPQGSRLLCHLSMTPQTFCPGGCIWARGAGCPRRLLTKQLTKSMSHQRAPGAPRVYYWASVVRPLPVVQIPRVRVPAI